jgi:hypothetical protein
MDLFDDDMGRWLLIFYYALSGLLRTDIEFLVVFLLIGYNEPIDMDCALEKAELSPDCCVPALSGHML